MGEFIKADVFFFITTVAIVVIGIALLVALIYVIKILHDIKHLSRAVKEEGDKIIQDVEYMRESFASKVISLFNPLSKRNKRKSSTKENK